MVVAKQESTDRAKVGVVGLGRFGEIHAQVWSCNPQVELWAVCSRSAERARQVAERYGARKWYTEYIEMLQDPELNAVDVCTELPRHAQVALASLQAGKHVLCEVLHALTLEETDDLIAWAEIVDVCFMVGLMERFDTRRALAKQKVAEGSLGQLVSLYVRRNVWRGFLESPRDRPYPLILQPGITSVDQMLWLAQERVLEVYARARAMIEPGRLDAWWAMLTFESGLIGVIEQSWFVPDHRRHWYDVEFQAVGTQGTYHFHEPSDGTWLWTAEATHSPSFFLRTELHGRPAGALVYQMAYFADCVVHGRRPTLGTLLEAREALRVGLAIVESAARKAVVPL